MFTSCPNSCPQNQRRQQKQEGKVTLDSLTSQSPAGSPQTDPTEPEDEEKADNGTHQEAPASQITSPETAVPEEEPEKPDVDQINGEREEEEEEDSVMDCNATAASAVSNRFTVLSEDQNSKDSISEDGKTSEVEQEVDKEEDARLAGELESMSLNDAFLEDPDAAEQGMECGDARAAEAKEYTVVNEDPELAFQTLTTRTAPEKQECSVQSCLFQFTEVENLTQKNSLLCVTCTKRQSEAKNSEGIYENVFLW